MFKFSRQDCEFWRGLGVGGARAEFDSDLFGGRHRRQDRFDHFGGACAAGFVGELPLHQLGMRQDDAQLIIQLVKQTAKLGQLVSGSPLEQVGNGERDWVHGGAVVRKGGGERRP